jgi:hypothetical protein
LELVGLLGPYVGAGACFAIVAMNFYVPGQSWNRTIPSRQLLTTFGLLLALTFTIIACQIFGSVPAFATIRGIICHPAFVVALWLFLMWGVYRRWQKQRGVADD